jgi:hypothetical protein
MSTPTKIPKVTKVWTQRNGEKIRICDMGDQHLINTIRMLERVAEKRKEAELCLACVVASLVQGEQASMDIDSAVDALLEDDNVDDWLHPLYDDLRLDAERRGLKVE